MANQIIIDIGAAANDGTGDPLRTAFNFVNENFSNVWNTGLPTSNVAFSGNRILTVNTNGNLILAPNGIGKVQANVDIVPNMNVTHSLGALDRRWNTVYTQYLDVTGDIDFAGDVTVSGNLTVEGDTIQIGNIVTDTKTIQLSNTAVTANAANGSGITVGANDNIATFLYNSSSNVWTTNIGLTVTGNLTTFTGTVSANNINFTNDLYGKTGTFTGDSRGENSIYAGVPLFTNLGSDVIAQFSGNVDAYTQFNFQNGNTGTQASGDFVITADNGNDTSHFLNLGITGSGWNGTQPNSLGNRLGPNDGYLYVQDGDMVIGTNNGTIETWKFDQTGNLTVPGDIIPTGNNTQNLGSLANQWADLYISNATIFMNGVPITLGAGNVLTVDGQAILSNDSNTSISTTGNISATNFIASEWVYGNVDVSQIQMNDGVGNSINLLNNSGSLIYESSAGASGGFIPASPNTETIGRADNPWGNIFGNSLCANTVISTLGEATGNIVSNVRTWDSAGANLYVWFDANQTPEIVELNTISGGNVTGWTVAVDGGNQALITATNPAGYFSISTDQALTGSGTLTFTSPGYAPPAANPLTVTVGANDWTFDNTGNLTLPSGTPSINYANGQPFSSGANIGNLEVTGTTIGIANGAPETTMSFGGTAANVVVDTDTGAPVINIYAQSTDFQGYSQGGGDFTSAEWVAGGGGGQINITGSQSYIDSFLNNLGQYSQVTLEINGTDTVPYDGASYGGGSITLFTTQAPPVDPTAVTQIGFNLTFNNGLTFDPDEGDMLFRIGDFNLNITSLRDINLTASDDLRITGNDLTQLRGNAEVTITADYANTAQSWFFRPDGNLVLANGSSVIQSVPSSSLDPLNPGVSTMVLTPSDSYTSQALVLDPTAPGHIHLRAPSGTGNIDEPAANLFLGGELSSFEVGSSFSGAPNVFVHSNNNTWTFGTDGVLTAPGNITTLGNISGAYILGNGSQLTGLPAGYANSDVANLLSSFGSNSISTTGNITASNFFGNVANLTNSGNTFSMSSLGVLSLSDAGQTYLTMDRFGITANTQMVLSAANSVSGNNSSILFDKNGGGIVFRLEDTTPVSKTWGFYQGNVTFPDGSVQTSAYGNANVSTFLANYGSNSITTTGNITAGNISGNINITGNVTGTQSNVDLIAGSYLWSFNNTGNLVLPGNTFAVNYANGTAVSLGGTYGNANVADFLDSLGSNSIVTTGNVTASNFIGNIQLTGNVQGTSANVELVAGSYTWTFDNNGIVTLPAVGGNEGAELQLAQAANSTLAGNTVSIDQYIDQIRFFEGGGSTRGVYIDLSQAAAGVGTLLNNRVSGFVNAGTFVTMDNIKATVTTTGNRGLSLATVSGSITVNIAATYGGTSGPGGASAVDQTYTTTPSTSVFSWNFGVAGEVSTYNISDITNGRAYRITLQIGPSYNNNMISIERLI